MSDNAQVVRDAYERFARADIPALLELMSDDVRWDVPSIVPQGGSFEGRAGVGRFFAGVGENWSELQIDSTDLIANGNDVVALGTARGTLSSGRDAGYGFCHVFTIEGGQIARFREYVAVDEKLS